MRTRALLSSGGFVTTSEVRRRRFAKPIFLSALPFASKPVDETLGGAALAPARVRRSGGGGGGGLSFPRAPPGGSSLPAPPRGRRLLVLRARRGCTSTRAP